MKLYQIFNQIKGSIGINWYLGQLWPESFIEMANTAMLYVRTYLGRTRSWQRTTQAVTNFDTDNDKIYYYRTMFPITDTDISFYCWEEQSPYKTDPCEFQCACIDHIDLSCCNCSCPSNKLDLSYVQPWTWLNPWQFTIAWWSYWWWILGNEIKVYFPCVWCCCPSWQIYISYNAWPRLFKCLNDDIPLPDYYIEWFKLLLKWLMSTNIFNWQSNKETLWFTLAKEIIEWLDFKENNIPSRFTA